MKKLHSIWRKLIAFLKDLMVLVKVLEMVFKISKAVRLAALMITYRLFWISIYWLLVMNTYGIPFDGI